MDLYLNTSCVQVGDYFLKRGFGDSEHADEVLPLYVGSQQKRRLSFDCTVGMDFCSQTNARKIHRVEILLQISRSLHTIDAFRINRMQEESDMVLSPVFLEVRLSGGRDDGQCLRITESGDAIFVHLVDRVAQSSRAAVNCRRWKKFSHHPHRSFFDEVAGWLAGFRILDDVAARRGRCVFRNPG